MTKKLVRDNIPNILGVQPEIIQDDNEYIKALKKKLDEETKELKAAKTVPEIMEEMADVLEVLSCIAKVHGINNNELFAIADAKRAEKGSFIHRARIDV